MEVLYHGIKTRYAYDFQLCFPLELIMSLISNKTECSKRCTILVLYIADLEIFDCKYFYFIAKVYPFLEFRFRCFKNALQKNYILTS